MASSVTTHTPHALTSSSSCTRSAHDTSQRNHLTHNTLFGIIFGSCLATAFVFALLAFVRRRGHSWFPRFSRNRSPQQGNLHLHTLPTPIISTAATVSAADAITRSRIPITVLAGQLHAEPESLPGSQAPAHPLPPGYRFTYDQYLPEYEPAEIPECSATTPRDIV